MVDPRRIRQLLDRIADEEAHVRRLAGLDSDHLLENHDLLSAVKYGFVVIIESAIDVGRHVIPPRDWRSPTVTQRCSRFLETPVS